jgi:ATP adenylyltransferase
MKLINLMLIIFIYFCLAKNNLCNVQNAIKNECGYGQIYLSADRSVYNDNLGKKTDICPLCEKLQMKTDDKNFILKRTKHSYVCLNYYPYMKGHLLVLPQRHVGDMSLLTDEELIDLSFLIRESVSVLKQWKADGINVGINLGKCAGASIPDHLHVHILPRFDYNLNYAFLLSNIIVIDESLETVFPQLKRLFLT